MAEVCDNCGCPITVEKPETIVQGQIGTNGADGATGPTGPTGPTGGPGIVDIIRLRLVPPSIAKHTSDAMKVASVAGPGAPTGDDVISKVLTGMTVEYNLNNGTPCYTYNALAGTITMLKAGKYNFTAFLSLGANVSAGYWGSAAGYFMLGLNDGTLSDYYATFLQAIANGQGSKFIALNFATSGANLSAGAVMRPIVLNRSAKVYTSDTHDILTLSVQRVGA